MQRDPNITSSGQYKVTSIYFDTPGLRHYHENEAGLFARRKIRQRFYNDERRIRYWEVKQKRGDSIMKIRFPLILKSSWTSFVYTQYRPILWVQYKREPWIVPNQDIRLTFDSHIITWRALGEQFFYHCPTKVFDGLIMEVKFASTIPQWLAACLRQYNLERQALGKYRFAVEALGMRTNHG